MFLRLSPDPAHPVLVAPTVLLLRAALPVAYVEFELLVARRWFWPFFIFGCLSPPGSVAFSFSTRILAPWAKGLRYLGFRRLRLRRRDIELRRIHRGQGNVGRMDRHNYGLIRRGRLWVLPAVEETIKGDDRTLTLHRWVAHLELRRRLGDGAGGIDLRIR
eukprot:scaffold14248_cov143-Isochrysis_galbana.AAC.4